MTDKEDLKKVFGNTIASYTGQSSTEFQVNLTGTNPYTLSCTLFGVVTVNNLPIHTLFRSNINKDQKLNCGQLLQPYLVRVAHESKNRTTSSEVAKKASNGNEAVTNSSALEGSNCIMLILGIILVGALGLSVPMHIIDMKKEKQFKEGRPLSHNNQWLSEYLWTSLFLRNPSALLTSNNVLLVLSVYTATSALLLAVWYSTEVIILGGFHIEVLFLSLFALMPTKVLEAVLRRASHQTPKTQSKSKRHSKNTSRPNGLSNSRSRSESKPPGNACQNEAAQSNPLEDKEDKEDKKDKEVGPVAPLPPPPTPPTRALPKAMSTSLPMTIIVAEAKPVAKDIAEEKEEEKGVSKQFKKKRSGPPPDSHPAENNGPKLPDSNSRPPKPPKRPLSPKVSGADPVGSLGQSKSSPRSSSLGFGIVEPKVQAKSPPPDFKSDELFMSTNGIKSIKKENVITGSLSSRARMGAVIVGLVFIVFCAGIVQAFPPSTARGNVSASSIIIDFVMVLGASILVWEVISAFIVRHFQIRSNKQRRRPSVLPDSMQTFVHDPRHSRHSRNSNTGSSLFKDVLLSPRSSGTTEGRAEVQF